MSFESQFPQCFADDHPWFLLHKHLGQVGEEDDDDGIGRTGVRWCPDCGACEVVTLREVGDMMGNGDYERERTKDSLISAQPVRLPRITSGVAPLPVETFVIHGFNTDGLSKKTREKLTYARVGTGLPDID